MLQGIGLQDEALPFTELPNFEFRRADDSFWGSEATMLMKTLGRNRKHGSKATMSMKVKALRPRTTMSLMGKGLERLTVEKLKVESELLRSVSPTGSGTCLGKEASRHGAWN